MGKEQGGGSVLGGSASVALWLRGQRCRDLGCCLLWLQASGHGAEHWGMVLSVLLQHPLGRGPAGLSALRAAGFVAKIVDCSCEKALIPLFQELPRTAPALQQRVGVWRGWVKGKPG